MDQRQFFLRDILTVIFKHLTLLIVLPLVILAVVFVGNYVWPPTFESEAKVRLMRGREVSQTDPTVTQTQQGVTMIQMGIEDINSEVELIHSRDVLLSVVKRLNLDETDFPYYAGILNAPFKIARSTTNALLYALQLRSRPIGPDGPAIAAMRELDKRLFVEPIRDSHVLTVRLRLGNREEAQRILDEILKDYIQKHIDVFANPESKPFFEEQRRRVAETLTIAENELQEFRRENNISLLDTEKELLLEQFTAARTTMIELQEVEAALSVEGVDASLIQSLSGHTESVAVREMQLRLLELLTEFSRVAQTLGPNHSQYQSLQNQVRNMQQNLIEAIANVKKITQNKLTDIDTRLVALNETRAKLDRLEREVELLSDDYTYYASKLEESFVADELARLQVSNVRIVSEPTMPVDPVRPNKLLNLGLALLGGVIASLALAFFLDYLDHGLKTPEDVEHSVKVPPLASFFNAHGQALDPRQAERLAVLIDSVGIEGNTKVLMITSSIGGEGSGGVTTALANAYAADPNMRTLLVDLAGDLARARNARYGLTDVLLDQADFDEVFEKDNNITILGRGTHSDYPPHLWGSERMKTLLADLRNRYEHILIHVGPILQSQDALPVARHVDSILLVVKADSTRREVVSRALDSIRDARSKVIGAVMTERTQKIPNAVYRRI